MYVGRFVHMYVHIHNYIHACKDTNACIQAYMSQDEGDLIDLLGISSLIMFSGKSLHYSIPMMSLVMS